MSERHDIAGNLKKVRADISKALARAGRDKDAARLVAVSKTHEAAAVEKALAAGQRHFGENRVQEAAAKWPGLKQRHQDVVLHLIGQLQSNKADEAVGLFDVIETLDRSSLATALAAAIEKAGRSPKILIQVNTGEEPQKGGVSPAGLDGLLAEARALGLVISGLMCIPPADEDPAPHFAFLAELAKRHGLQVLSMGMSGDYAVALQLGATYVRVGTAIFGDRAHAL